jgi:hypothetical protein
VVKRHERLRVWQSYIDTTLTPPGTQYGATEGNPQKRKTLRNAHLQSPAHPCNA